MFELNIYTLSIKQVAELVGETKEYVEEVIAKFTPQLDQLQQKDETITSAPPLDPDVISDQYCLLSLFTPEQIFYIDRGEGEPGMEPCHLLPVTMPTGGRSVSM